MKRVITILGLALIATVGFNNSASAQVEQGNVIFDPYIGVPTSNLLWGALADSAGFTTIGSPVSFGVRGEFMAADNFGVGVDFNYAISGYERLETNYFDPNTNVFVDATYRYTAKKIRAMLRLNYHFVQTEVLDAYFGVGAGFRNVKRTITYNGNEELGGLGITAIPVSFRIAMGARYYFTDNIGAMLELGTSGGSAIQFGLSVKI